MHFLFFFINLILEREYEACNGAAQLSGVFFAFEMLCWNERQIKNTEKTESYTDFKFSALHSEKAASVTRCWPSLVVAPPPVWCADVLLTSYNGLLVVSLFCVFVWMLSNVKNLLVTLKFICRCLAIFLFATSWISMSSDVRSNLILRFWFSCTHSIGVAHSESSFEACCLCLLSVVQFVIWFL